MGIRQNHHVWQIALLLIFVLAMLFQPSGLRAEKSKRVPPEEPIQLVNYTPTQEDASPIQVIVTVKVREIESNQHVSDICVSYDHHVAEPGPLSSALDWILGDGSVKECENEVPTSFLHQGGVVIFYTWPESDLSAFLPDEEAYRSIHDALAQVRKIGVMYFPRKPEVFLNELRFWDRADNGMDITIPGQMAKRLDLHFTGRSR